MKTSTSVFDVSILKNPSVYHFFGRSGIGTGHDNSACSELWIKRDGYRVV